MITFAVCHCCFSRPGKKWPPFLLIYYIWVIFREIRLLRMVIYQHLKKIKKIAKFLHFENRGKSSKSEVDFASFSTKFQCHVENNDVVGLKLWRRNSHRFQKHCDTYCKTFVYKILWLWWGPHRIIKTVALKHRRTFTTTLDFSVGYRSSKEARPIYAWIHPFPGQIQL